MKHTKRQFHKKKSLLARLKKLPELCSTTEAIKALLCHERTFRGWLKREEFRAVAELQETEALPRWVIDREALILWVLALRFARPSPEYGYPSPVEAWAALGLSGEPVGGFRGKVPPPSGEISAPHYESSETE